MSGTGKKGFIFMTQASLLLPGIISCFLGAAFLVVYPRDVYCGSGSDQEPRLDSKTYTLERLIFKKVNQERRRSGLKALRWSPLLTDVARRHSLDMADNGFFSHKNSRGEDLAVRARKGGIAITGGQIGENIGMIPGSNAIGYGYTGSLKDIATAMVSTWMKSPGHRANILNADYSFTGVGVAHDGRETYYITQDFR